MQPQATLAQLALRDGMKVGDFGAGSGHYALSASAMVGETGKVYAIDVQEEVLKRLISDANARGAHVIETVWADFEKPGATKLKDGVLDAAILSNALFQLEDKQGALSEIFRVLRRGAKLLVVDWSGPHGGMGPADAHVVTQSEALALLEAAGFKNLKSFDPGAHHYALVVTKPA